MALFFTLFFIFLLMYKIPIISEFLIIILIVLSISFVVTVGMEYNKIQSKKQVEMNR